MNRIIYFEHNKLIKVIRNLNSMVLELFIMWWCIESQYCKDTGDISNIFSTIVGTVVGFIIGGLISWLIYSRQEKTANKQEHILETIQAFE